MARRSKLSGDRVETIVSAVERGAYRVPAAKSAGISESTLYRWLDVGEAHAAAYAELEEKLEAAEADGKAKRTLTRIRKERDTFDTLERELWEGIEKAEASAEIEAVGVVRKAADDGDWKAAMTYLERKYPARWGRRIAVRDETPQAPAPINRPSIDEHEAALAAAFGDVLPEGIDPAELMPAIGGDE